jgi:hypothetical protein
MFYLLLRGPMYHLVHTDKKRLGDLPLQVGDLLQLMWKLMWSRKSSFFSCKPPQIYWA